MAGWILFLLLAAFVFIVFYLKGQKELAAHNRLMALEELEALEKHSIRYWLTPAEKERLTYLKAYVQETTPSPGHQGSALGAAAMLGVAGYVMYKNVQDDKRTSAQLRQNYKG